MGARFVWLRYKRFIMFAQIIHECRSLLEDFGKRTESHRMKQKLRQAQGLRAMVQKETGKTPENHPDIAWAKDLGHGQTVNVTRSVANNRGLWGNRIVGGEPGEPRFTHGLLRYKASR